MFFSDYLAKQIRKFMVIVTILVAIIILMTTLLFGKLATHINLLKDNNYVISIINEDRELFFKSVETFMEVKQVDVDKNDIKDLMYQIRTSSKIKFNFTVLDHDLRVLTSNLYATNQKKFIDNLKNIPNLASMKESNNREFIFEKLIAYNPLQESAYTYIYSKDNFLFVIEPLKESLAELENSISSNLIISDEYDNILFDGSSNYSNALNKVSLSNKKNLYSKNIISPYIVRTTSEQLKFLSILLLSIVTLLLTFLVSLVLLNPLVKKLTMILDEPLNEMLTAFKTAKKGDFDQYIQTSHFIEFNTIFHEYNVLLKNTKSLLIKNEELSEAKRIIEIKHLKSQFNPHFIYNALESIRYEIIFDPENASEMMLSLGRLMRYSIEDQKMFVKVYQDVDYLDDYLKLQKMRYQERLKYQIDIDENIRNLQIPKLILQPIIENSIKHNMEKLETLNINLKGELLEDKIVFTINDNGIGISQERISLMKKKFLMDEREEQLGLYNINKAIKLLYGAKYGLDLRNNRGLEVIVTLPRDGGGHD